MKKVLLSTAAGALFAIAAPAQAAQITTCSGNCLPSVQNVNLDDATNVNAGTGTVPDTGAKVDFSSTENIDLVTGAAQITATTGLLNQLTFVLRDPFTFTQAAFNLQMQGGTADYLIETTNGTRSGTLTSGSNNFLVSADAGETLKSVSISSVDGFNRFEQLKISAGNGVPEPSTWAMMLVGFGFLGASMRRKKSTTVTARVRFA